MSQLETMQGNTAAEFAGKPVVIDVVTDENAMAPTAWTGGAASGH